MVHFRELEKEIARLKREKNALIVAHNYQNPEVQELADFSGDSLELARRAKEAKEDVIVFCGVHFMAQTAALLSPSKRVLLPDENAGCPMADMITAEDVLELRSQHPDAAVVCYVNSTAQVKAVSDVCCTSSNAVDVVSSIEDDRPVIFIPDKYLGAHVERCTGRKMILWPGYCPTHARLSEGMIEEARREHPGAPVIVHPECRSEVCLAADAVLSTGGMVEFARHCDETVVVVGTEVGLLHRLGKENPEKRFVPLNEGAVCPNMKLVTPEKVLWSLQDEEPRIVVPQEIAERAAGAVERMLGCG